MERNDSEMVRYWLVILLASDQNENGGDVNYEGRMVKRYTCHPTVATTDYVRSKSEHFKEVLKPKRQAVMIPIRGLEGTLYPTTMTMSQAISQPAEKRIRGDRDHITNQIFALFEKQQYYSAKELEKRTNQPKSYIVEIMKEIGNFNKVGPHRNQWQLKEGYSCYQLPES